MKQKPRKFSQDGEINCECKKTTQGLKGKKKLLGIEFLNYFIIYCAFDIAGRISYPGVGAWFNIRGDN